MQKFVRKILKTATLLGALALTGVAHAQAVLGQGSWETTLQARDLDGNAANGAEAFYDTALNVTWLRAGITGVVNWPNAKSWAEQHHFGLSGWRLPTTHVTTTDGSCDYSDTGGTSCGRNPDSSVATGSEMAHLFYRSLGNKSSFVPGTTTHQPGGGLTNTGDFQNLQSYAYWSDTEYAPYMDFAWYFQNSDGSQAYAGKTSYLYALAVRPGDVTAAVPEPESYALMLLGLTGMLLASRRPAP